jgi:hypothetical protein
MIDFKIDPPTKKPTEYLFSYRRYSQRGKLAKFGFRMNRVDLPHGTVWDTLYPLLYLTRNGGPVFNKHDQVGILFDYPVVDEVVETMKQRCRSQGIELQVSAPDSVEPTFGAPVWDHVVGFGGGKESSLICGMARELGYSPMMLMGSPRPSTPAKRWTWDDIRFFRPLNKGVSDRLVVQLMCGANLYHGSCLDDSMRTTPWHQYFDIGSQEGWNQMNAMFDRLGMGRRVYTPLEPVPCAMVSTVLCERYPEVARLRKSVDLQSKGEKNMHVSLCEMMGGIDPSDHCSPELLRQLVGRFMEKYEKGNYGKRDARKLAMWGMLAMLHHLRGHEILSGFEIPDSWKREFIHYGHFYKDTPDGFGHILAEHLEPAPASPDDWEGGVWVG